MFYSYIIGTSSDSKTVSHFIKCFEEIGVIKRTNEDDVYIVNRIKDSGITVFIKKTKDGVKFQFFMLNLE